LERLGVVGRIMDMVYRSHKAYFYGAGKSRWVIPVRFQFQFQFTSMPFTNQVTLQIRTLDN
jgi:hypothetical protein